MCSASSSRLGRGGAEISQEARIVVDGAAEIVARGPGDAVHRRAPFAADRPRRAERGLQRRRRVDLERAEGDTGQAELGLNHLSLFGDAQRAVDRARRLRLDRQIGRAAAAADGSAAAVEQRDGHAVFATRRDDRLLRLVELPCGGEPPDVLCRIGVADHDFLTSLVAHDPGAVPGNRQQPVHHVRRGAQVAGRLEQRHDPQRPRDARFALQQLHREHVRRPAGLGDDVGAQRIARHLRNGPERRQDVGHRRLRPQPFGAEHALLRRGCSAGNRRAALRSTRRSCRVPCAGRWHRPLRCASPIPGARRA